MKCPYNRLSICSQSASKNEYVKDSELLESCSSQYVETYSLMECLKEECGAWQNGKCVRIS